MNETATVQEPTSTGTRFVLPRRRLGTWATPGPPLLAGGLFTVGEAVFDIGVLIHAIATYTPNANRPFDWSATIFAGVSEIPQLFAGGLMIVVGSALIASRTIVELRTRDRKPELMIIERIGIKRFRRSPRTPFSALALDRQILRSINSDENDDLDDSDRVRIPDGDDIEIDTADSSARFAALIALPSVVDYERPTRSKGRSGGAVLAAFYSEPVLLDLVRSMRPALRHAGLLEDPAPAPLAETAEYPTADADRSPAAPSETTPSAGPKPLQPPPLPMPAKCRAEVERRPGELSITLPARGLLKGKGGMLGFGIFWTGFTIVHSIFFIGGIVGSGSWHMLWFIVPFYSIFYAIGIFTLGWGVHTGTARTSIDVIGSSMLITERSRIRQQLITVDRDNIRSLRVAETSTKVNDVPILALRIRTDRPVKVGRGRNKSTLMLLSERADPELRWLAATLRHELALSAEDDR